MERQSRLGYPTSESGCSDPGVGLGRWSLRSPYRTYRCNGYCKQVEPMFTFQMCWKRTPNYKTGLPSVLSPFVSEYKWRNIVSYTTFYVYLSVHFRSRTRVLGDRGTTVPHGGRTGHLHKWLDLREVRDGRSLKNISKVVHPYWLIIGSEVECQT